MSPNLFFLKRLNSTDKKNVNPTRTAKVINIFFWLRI